MEEKAASEGREAWVDGQIWFPHTGGQQDVY